MSLVSDIKLIRTDTTLDLSQKAEKGILLQLHLALVIPRSAHDRNKTYGTNFKLTPETPIIVLSSISREHNNKNFDENLVTSPLHFSSRANYLNEKNGDKYSWFIS